MALGQQKRAYEEMKYVSEKLQSNLHHCGTQFHNLATGYLILGRLYFFSSVSQNSSLKCEDWWLILAITLLCALVYFVLFLDAVTMLLQLQHQLHMILKKLAEIDQQILEPKHQDHDVLAPPMEAGELCCDDYGFELGFYEKMLMYDHFRVVGMKFYVYITASALLLVTSVELYACNYLLCS